ncbi:MAG TPA: MipA/OmpV family protein [Steroidobacteraceae bacterium]|nr:MipA/OmpV family protein [Steroidobacteraceae bacterium]
MGAARRLGIAVACIVAILSRTAAAADDECKGPSDDCVAVGKWNFSVALGAGVRTNPVVNSEDIPLVVVPHVSYYGKRFFWDDLDLGFTLADSDANTVSLIATPGYDRVYFYRTDLQNFFITGYTSADTAIFSKVPPAAGAPASTVSPTPRRITYLAGPEWTFKTGTISGQLDLLHEITGQNHGDEIRAALGIPLIEHKGALTANVGITWKSAAIVNYYYGVTDIYRGTPALDPFAKLGYTVPWSGRWRFNGFVEYERLGSGIANSPIVAEHGVVTVFVGAVRSF